MIPSDGRFGPGWWYTAEVGTLGPANSARQEDDAPRFVDAWPPDWKPVGGHLSAQLRSELDYGPRGGRSHQAVTLRFFGTLEWIRRAVGSGSALGYESDDRTVRAVFFDACVDKDGPRGEWLDVAIVEPSSALSQYTFVVYTAGVLNLPESVAYYIGP